MKKHFLLFFAMAALMALPQQLLADDVVINEQTFPDENFRNWVLAQDYGQDGVLTEEEIAGVTYIGVSYQGITDLTGIEFFTALTWLECYDNQLTSLDVSQNTALTGLNCGGNQLTSLDVSKNTALTYLSCGGNQLTSLEVTQNTALGEFHCNSNQLTSLDVSKNMVLTLLNCSHNQLTTLDVSKNTALEQLYSSGNQLTSLDVSKNTALIHLICYDNQLTSLDVSQNSALTYLYCYDNQLKGAAMDALIAGLPGTGGEFHAIAPDYSNEQNVVTKAQVAAAKEKGWTTYYNDWEEYEGSDPQEIAPVGQGETIDMGTEIDADTDLDGNVVGDVYYSISSGDGSYDPTEGCIVVTKPTDDSAIDGKDIFGEDFKAGYTGVVFMVSPGSGTVKVEAQTQGNMVLKVKIGDNDPIEMELEGKLKVSFPYSVSDDTYVYIYGGTNAAGAKGMMKAAGTDMLKIYGIEVSSETDGIEDIKDERLKMKDSSLYNLNGQRVISSPSGRPGGVPTKGIYIQNGKKVLVK